MLNVGPSLANVSFFVRILTVSPTDIGASTASSAWLCYTTCRNRFSIPLTSALTSSGVRLLHTIDVGTDLVGRTVVEGSMGCLVIYRNDIWEPFGSLGVDLKEHILVHQFPQSANEAIDYAESVGVLRDMIFFGDPRVDVHVQNIDESSEPFGIELIVAIDSAQVTA
jgi:hypothetical protein